MRQLLPFLACLMLVLTTWASIGHATETAGCVTAVGDSALHADGDSDQVPADADNPVPHHHGGCHGHHVGTLAAATMLTHSVDRGRLIQGPAEVLIADAPDPARRPPKA